jgi:aspartyl-tRNA(Asn)/glutamyl-tRNA(Gln) amidotransferase subunit C
MAVTTADVLKIAGLARLRLDDTRIASLTSELNGILAHMEALNRVDTSNVTPTAGGGGADDGMRRRPDVVAPIPMDADGASLAAQSREGFILVPRLATHEDV